MSSVANPLVRVHGCSAPASRPKEHTNLHSRCFLKDTLSSHLVGVALSLCPVVGVSSRFHPPLRVPLVDGRWSDASVTVAAALAAGKATSSRGRDNTCRFFSETDVETRTQGVSAKLCG